MTDHEIASKITAALLLPETGQRAAAVRDLISEIQHEHDYDEAHAENIRIDLIAENDRVDRELAAEVDDHIKTISKMAGEIGALWVENRDLKAELAQVKAERDAACTWAEELAQAMGSLRTRVMDVVAPQMPADLTGR